MRQARNQIRLVIVSFVTIFIVLLPMGVPRNQIASAQEPAVKMAAQAFVIESGDGAQVRRVGWNAFTHLSVGTALFEGDLVDPKESSVQVICDDLTTHLVVAIGSVPCPAARKVFIQGEVTIAGWQRGKPADATIPYLISPRGTLIATANPTILWNPIDGADSYQITLRGENLNWSGEVKGQDTHQFTYPKTAPKLVAGSSYTVEIVAQANGVALSSSTEEDASGISFQLMTPDQLTPVKTLSDKVGRGVTDPNVAALIVARLYMQQGVYADALTRLLPTIAQSDSPVFPLVLGDIYLSTHVPLEATSAYTDALAQAQQRGDLETQAYALTGLARLTPDPTQQAQYILQIISIWTGLGATERVAELSQEFASK